MKCQNLFFCEKNMKNINKLLSAELAKRVVKVKRLIIKGFIRNIYQRQLSDNNSRYDE